MKSPILLVLLTVLMWSTGPAFTKAINFPGNAALYTIMAIATLIGFEALLFLQQKKLYFPKLSEIFSRNGLIAGLAIGPYWLFMALAVQSSSNAATPWAVQYIWPIFTTLFFSLLFTTVHHGSAKESLMSWLGMIVGFLGILVLYFGNNGSDNFDDAYPVLFALIAAVSYGFYSAYASTIRNEAQLEFLILSCVSGLLILIPWSLLEYRMLGELTAFVITSAFLYGLVTDSLGSYFLIKAIRMTHENNQKMSSITSLILFLPFVSMLFLYLTFKEEQILKSNFIYGLILLFTGTFLCRKRL